MKEVIVKLYEFKELSGKAQQKAVDNLYDINVDYQWWDFTFADAENVGLKITEFDERYAKGEIITSYGEVVESILSEHGDQCSTYKTALEYKHKFQLPSDECNEEELEADEDEFLKSLLEDYRIILRNEYEYLTSKEAIIETIEANEYLFTEDGKLSNL